MDLKEPLIANTNGLKMGSNRHEKMMGKAYAQRMCGPRSWACEPGAAWHLHTCQSASLSRNCNPPAISSLLASAAFAYSSELSLSLSQPTLQIWAYIARDAVESHRACEHGFITYIHIRIQALAVGGIVWCLGPGWPLFLSWWEDFCCLCPFLFLSQWACSIAQRNSCTVLSQVSAELRVSHIPSLFWLCGARAGVVQSWGEAQGLLVGHILHEGYDSSPTQSDCEGHMPSSWAGCVRACKGADPCKRTAANGAKHLWCGLMWSKVFFLTPWASDVALQPYSNTLLQNWTECLDTWLYSRTEHLTHGFIAVQTERLGH